MDSNIIKVIEIRKIETTDSSSIGDIIMEPGSTIKTEWISSIISNKDHLLYVAIQNEKIIGFIHAFRTLRLTSPPFIEICGLVVKDGYRNKGIGSRLVRHIESYRNNENSIRVRCNVKRKLAHQFYKSIGYSEKKEQKVFEKKF